MYSVTIRRLFVLVVVLFTFPALSYAQLPCQNVRRLQSVNIDLSAGTGNLAVVSATQGYSILVCGYVLSGGAAGVVTFVYGTGTNCATSPVVAETFEFSTNVGFGYAISNTGHPQFVAIQGNSLCLGRSTSMTLRGRITYVLY